MTCSPRSSRARARSKSPTGGIAARSQQAGPPSQCGGGPAFIQGPQPCAARPSRGMQVHPFGRWTPVIWQKASPSGTVIVRVVGPEGSCPRGRPSAMRMVMMLSRERNGLKCVPTSGRKASSQGNRGPSGTFANPNPGPLSSVDVVDVPWARAWARTWGHFAPMPPRGIRRGLVHLPYSIHQHAPYGVEGVAMYEASANANGCEQKNARFRKEIIEVSVMVIRAG